MANTGKSKMQDYLDNDETPHACFFCEHYNFAESWCRVYKDNVPDNFILTINKCKSFEDGLTNYTPDTTM
jgi:hypothetical protein